MWCIPLMPEGTTTKVELVCVTSGTFKAGLPSSATGPDPGSAVQAAVSLLIKDCVLGLGVGRSLKKSDQAHSVVYVRFA